jgi:hypothetical protein
MSRMLETCALSAVLLMCLLHAVSLAAPSTTGLGRSLDEVVASAKKEGKVLIGSGLADDEVQTVLHAKVSRDQGGKYPAAHARA